MPVTPTSEQRRRGGPLCPVKSRASHGKQVARAGQMQGSTQDITQGRPGDRGRLLLLPRRHLKWLCSSSLN